MNILKTIEKAIEDGSLRCVGSKGLNMSLFCATEVCAVLCGTSYATAKNYWKTAKRRDSYFDIEKGYDNKQLTMVAKDGKVYKTDVVDVAGFIYLLKRIQYRGSNKFNWWLSRRKEFELRQLLKKLVERVGMIVRREVERRGKELMLYKIKEVGWYKIKTGVCRDGENGLE